MVLLGFLLLVWLLLQTEFVQNIIIRKVTARLSNDLKTEVSIKHVSLTLFNKMNLEGTLIKDRGKDTLLYAGALKVRITDFFFWRDKADLKYVGLEDAVIKLQRKDSTWNYQFVVDYFSSPPDSNAKKLKADTSKGLALNLQKLDLKNVRFIQNDLWVGQRMEIRTGSLLMDADTTDLNTANFKINSIELDKPYFSIKNFDGLRPDSLRKLSVDTGMYFNSGDIAIRIKTINLTNGSFVNELMDNLPVNDYFDGNHILFSKINGKIEDFSFLKDTIKANITLAAKERSGFDLKKLKAQFRLTPQIMEFAKLDLRTNRSRIGDYYSMRYDDFNDDMNEYIDSVIMNVRFRYSQVSSDDVAYFAPELKNWNKTADISGRFYGTVADFDVTDLFLRSGNDTYVAGDLSMKGLPDIDRTNIVFHNGNVQTTYSDLASVIPSVTEITNPNLATLGKLRFMGSFTGSIYNFSVNGTASTAIGGLYTNIRMQFPKRAEPRYTGSIITKQFDLGKFLDAEPIGLVSFNGKISGSSFDINKIRTSLDGNFSRFDFNNYSYSNLVFNGNIQNKFFNGEFKASDPNFDFTSNIEIDLTGEKPHFNILGDLVKGNLQKLNLTNQNFQLTGLFDLNFEGRNIDEFTGWAKILNASLLHDSTKLSFDSLSINAYYDSANNKVLYAQSNEFDIKVDGQYNILNLPENFQAFLSHYYPAYINPPAAQPKNQNFSVSIITRDFDKYARLIDPKLSGVTNATITGSIDTKDSGKFTIKTDIPFAKYDKYTFQDAMIGGTGDYRSLLLTGNINRIYISDSTYFPNTTIRINSEKDHSDVHISTSANNTLNDAQLNADVYTLPDGVRIDFQPSSFVINDKKWNLEKQGEILIKKDSSYAQNVKFTQGFQEITFETDEEDTKSVNNLLVKLKNVNLGDFTPLITKQPRMEGIVNGTIHLHDFYGPFNIETNLITQQFRLDNDSVGVVRLKGLYDNKTGRVNYEAISDNENFRFAINGTYDVKDSTGSPLSAAIQLNHTKVGIVNEFLGDLFDNIDGYATGTLNIKGDPSAPDLLGTIALKDAGITVKYTNVRYTIDSALFKFGDGFIDFGSFKIKDANNNTGIVRGKLYEREFKNMQYDFDITTNKLIMLNTTAQDNDAFYGKAIGKATISLKGPQENLHLNVVGEVNDTTHIFIPTYTNSQSTSADFIVFKQYGIEMKTPEEERTNLSIDLDLTATNQAQVDVILDELTGDVIKATGNGRLQIKIPASGSMTMKGRYNIERGRYDFNFQQFIRKPFEFVSGAGNYIEWTGDPYNANIHIDAQYTASRVSVNDLVSNQSATGINSTVKGYRGDVYVIAELRGKLNKPDINFRLDFPSNSAIKNDNDFALFMNRLQSDQNEMLKQVTYLIVFGSFAPYGEARTATNAYSLGLNTISQKITAEINKLVANLLYRITGDKSLQLDVATSTYSSASLIGGNVASSNRLDRQTVNLKINQSLQDGKVIITFGGDLDFNLGNTSAVQNGNFQWLPDLSVQIVLSKDRKLRAVIFSKSTLDVSANSAIGRRNRQGVSLSYTKDFQKLFGTKPKDTPKINRPDSTTVLEGDK